MTGLHRISLSTVPALAALALTFTGCSSPTMAPMASAPMAQDRSGMTQAGTAFAHGHAGGSQDLYIGNILGGVLLYSTGKNPEQVGDITDQLPRVTGVWLDHTGVLYAFVDNRNNPYETIEEFQPGANSPFFSLVVQHYGSIVAADAHQNV
ncbi:MAG: hypothetical protein JO263_05665, partial [Candidatus Eremiobacteraeota bacterium]|nr:hypothetical protein [Candidatus Eremiobacteraeota bacterium]